MSKIVLPHGKIPTDGLPPLLKDAIMKINENMSAIVKHLKALEDERKK